MITDKVVIAAFPDPEQARHAAGELRRVGFRDDQVVVAMGKRRSDRQGLLTRALQRQGAPRDACTRCEESFNQACAVIAVRSKARNAEAAEIMRRGGGEIQFNGDVEPEASP